jgi:hypothetical protein
MPGTTRRIITVPSCAVPGPKMSGAGLLVQFYWTGVACGGPG